MGRRDIGFSKDVLESAELGDRDALFRSVFGVSEDHFNCCFLWKISTIEFN